MSVTDQEDPLLKSSRREAWVCVIAWAVVTVYCVVYSYVYGYHRSAESLEFILGFPDWIFWGVIAPWVASTAFSAWFCLYFMTDEVLEESPENPVS